MKFKINVLYLILSYATTRPQTPWAWAACAICKYSAVLVKNGSLTSRENHQWDHLFQTHYAPFYVSSTFYRNTSRLLTIWPLVVVAQRHRTSELTSVPALYKMGVAGDLTCRYFKPLFCSVLESSALFKHIYNPQNKSYLLKPRVRGTQSRKNESNRSGFTLIVRAVLII